MAEISTYDPYVSRLYNKSKSCKAEKSIHYTQVSPAFLKNSDLAPDRGILQSELFTSRSQNLVMVSPIAFLTPTGK